MRSSIHDEQALIGAAIISGDGHNRVSLEPGEFADPFYGAVWKRIQTMRTVDALALESEFINERQRLIDATANLPTMATSVNLPKIAKRIRNAAQRRRVAKALADANQMLQRGASLSEVADCVVRATDGQTSGGCKLLADFLIPGYKALEQAQVDGKSVCFVPTGFVCFDREFIGLQIGGLIVVAGRPGMGKTAFASALARCASERAPVLIISMEMSGLQLAMRFYASEAGVSLQRMMQGKLSSGDWSKLAAATKKLMTTGIHINDTTSRTIADVVAEARRFKRLHGTIGMVVVDYLTLLDMPGGHNRNDAISETTRRLATLAGELECPVVLLSQLNRELEKRTDKRPMMSDLRDSGAIEQDAHQIIFPFRPEVYDKSPQMKGIALINLAKNRNGKTGTVQMEWVAESATFRDFI